MPSVPVDTWIIGAGDIYVDDALLGSTREANVFRILRELDATIPNGIGAKLARTDYYVRFPYPQLEFTMMELGETGYPLIIPAADVEVDGDDIVISDPDVRRLRSEDYHKFELRVPGLDGREARFTIPIGINVNDAEHNAADSPDPLGPRLMIEGRKDPDDTTAKMWTVRLVNGALS